MRQSLKSSNVLFLASSLLLVGCPNPVVVPAPTTPKLTDVRLVGHQICGPFTLPDQPIAFACLPLPTTIMTGWQLTPMTTPSKSDPTSMHANLTSVITVNGPSLTEIDVELVLDEATGKTKLLTAVDPTHPPGPHEVYWRHQVGVAATDAGNGKTWTITVVVSLCADDRHLKIFNRSGNPPTRSAPLEIHLIRAANEQDCSPIAGSTVLYGQAGPSKAAPGDPINPSPSGPCPGGAKEQLFGVCENCSEFHPHSADHFTGFEACSWDEVLAVFGYTQAGSTKSQICTIRRVSDRASCEGPP